MLTFLCTAPVDWIRGASEIIRRSDAEITPVPSEKTLSDCPGLCWWELRSEDRYASTLLDLLRSSTEIAEGVCLTMA
jgi:hypothetical protein